MSDNFSKEFCDGEIAYFDALTENPNQPTNTELQAALKRAEKAERACAEMRDCIADLECGFRSQFYRQMELRVRHALSTTCGDGWISKEEHEKIVAERDAALKLCNINYESEIAQLHADLDRAKQDLETRAT